MKKLMLLVIPLMLLLSSCNTQPTLEFNVVFESNGGTAIETVSAEDGDSISELPATVKDGYSFQGWFTGEGVSDTQFTNISIVSRDITLYAKWEVNQYTISFDSNGGTLVTDITQDYATTVMKPSEPTRDGYTFGRWCSDSSLTIEYVFSTMPAVDNILYAKWSINQYTITFDSTEGSLVDSLTQDYGTSVLEPTDSTRSGYTFGGWYSDSALMNAYTFTTMPANNQKVYAKWDIIAYDLLYSLQGGVNDVDNPDTFTVATTTILLEEPTKEGYTFLGWYFNAEYSGESTIEIALGTKGDITLYAKWSITSYDILYNNVDFYTLGDIQLLDGETITQIYLGGTHSSALTSTGRVFTWGDNSYGKLGDGTTTNRITPTEITSRFNLGVSETIISVNLGYEYSSALTSTGRVFTWGVNWFGQLGDGTTTNRITPTEITSHFNLGVSETIISVNLSWIHSSAITSEGRIFTWGSNDYGQLGDGTTTNRITPTEITSRFNLGVSETFISVNLGSIYSSALTSTGRVFTWGDNSHGKLGDGTTIDKNTPTEITSHFNLGVGETIISINLGTGHSSALSSIGRVFTWGENGSAQLGDGTSTYKNIPTEITSHFNLGVGETIISVNLGSAHSSALSSTGRVFTWGSNYNGQLGDGTLIKKNIPTEITSRFNLGVGETIISVNLGGSHSSALTSTGRVFTWGKNGSSQLGDGTTTDRNTPTEITRVILSYTHSETYDFGGTTAEYMPILEGYTFNGWYSDIYLTTPYTFTTMPANDIVLYGKWVPIV